MRLYELAKEYKTEPINVFRKLENEGIRLIRHRGRRDAGLPIRYNNSLTRVQEAAVREALKEKGRG